MTGLGGWMLSGLLITVLSGLYTSLWGAFKDCPYEGLKKKTFPRSIYFNIGIFIILALTPLWSLEGLGLVQLFFLIMGMERILTEIYKGFFRHERQDKYFIPSRITFFGKPVHNELLRYTTGVAAVCLVLALSWIPVTVTGFPGFAVTAYLTGLLVSLGGAYKDAPFEGFNFLKFQRSGLVLLALSPVFYLLGPVSLGFLIFMNGGLERFCVEYYKTYIQRNMSGKFRPDIEKDTTCLARRERFHYLALAIIAFMIIVYVYELRRS